MGVGVGIGSRNMADSETPAVEGRFWPSIPWGYMED